MADEGSPRPAGVVWPGEDDWGAPDVAVAPPAVSTEAREAEATPPRISTFAAGLLLGCGLGGVWG